MRSAAVTVEWPATLRCVETTAVILTRRVPVQRAVERDEIPYPYKVHDTTLRPLLNITIQKHNYIANYISRIY